MFNILKRLFSSGSNADKSNDTISIQVSTYSGNEVNSARELLKEATQLKKDKKFDEACEKLTEAYSADGSEELMAKERLRLPMYLQLAGRNDEGWRILNELNITYTDVYSQSDIANQMRVFLQKEKKHKQAIIFGAWCVCKGIECYRSSIAGTIEMADEMAKLGGEYNLLNQDDTVYAHTPMGNPITDSAYKLFQDRIDTDTSLDGVKETLLPMLKKAKLDSQLNDYASGFAEYLQTSRNYDFADVRDYFNNKFEPSNNAA